MYLYYKLKHCIQPIVLKTIYYGLFDSLINYGIIAWGGAYENSVKYLVNVQNKLIDRIFINNQLTAPLKLKENFVVSTLTNYFELCKNQYVERPLNTRTKQLPLPKVNKKLSTKNACYVAIKYFNFLPNDMKLLSVS